MKITCNTYSNITIAIYVIWLIVLILCMSFNKSLGFWTGLGILTGYSIIVLLWKFLINFPKDICLGDGYGSKPNSNHEFELFGKK